VHDVLIQGGQVVSAFTGEVFPADVAVDGDTISGVLPPGTAGPAAQTVDARGLVIAPGFVDAHMHIESTFVTPAMCAWLTLPRGTTTVFADPHEIVNVVGKPGLRWMVEDAASAPQTILYGVPSCVPALPGFETAGAVLGPADVAELLDWPGVAGLAEVMDYRAVVGGDARMRAVTGAARAKGRLSDGHCPGLSGADLSAYLAAGPDADHTKNAPAVAREKARLGMLLMLQEKSLQPEVIRALLGAPLRPPLCLVTDDVAPDAVVDRGHLDHVGRSAVRAGLPPPWSSAAGRRRCCRCRSPGCCPRGRRARWSRRRARCAAPWKAGATATPTRS
jgi:adenine deaminase